MATEQDLQDTLDAVKAELDTIKTGVDTAVATETDQAKQIASLQARIDELVAGQPVSQTQLDNLIGEANTLKAQTDAVLAALTPAATPTP